MEKKRPSEIGKFLRKRFECDGVDYCLYESRGAFQALIADVLEELGPYATRMVRWPGISIDKYERLKATSMIIQRYMLWPGHKAEGLWSLYPYFLVCNHILRYPSIDHPDGMDSITQFAFYHRDFFLEQPEKPTEENQEERPINKILNRLLGNQEEECTIDEEMNLLM
jgi:hypothetical protein